MQEPVVLAAEGGPLMATRAKPAASAIRRFGSIMPTGRGIVLPVFHQAVRGGRSLFPSRVFAPYEVQRVLKSGHQSRKIGAFVTKGPRRGWPILTLTLEERATCPRSCQQWQACYGNNMQAAERIEPGAELEAAIARELTEFAASHPEGFVVRLHVLGDFYSIDYVRFWAEMLTALPSLHVFGFTAHAPDSEIGRAVSLAALEHGWSRFAIRFSGARHALRAARVVEPGVHDHDAVACPAQDGATECCATCGLCWQSERSISFGRH